VVLFAQFGSILLLHTTPLFVWLHGSQGKRGDKCYEINFCVVKSSCMDKDHQLCAVNMPHIAPKIWSVVLTEQVFGKVDFGVR